MNLALIIPISASVPGPVYEHGMNMAYEIGRSGGRLHVKTVWRCSNLALARGELARWALGTDAARILIADDDTEFTLADVEALYAEDLDVVAGPYVQRVPDGAIVGAPLEGGEQRGHLLEMDWVGLGLCMVKHNVLAKLIDQHGWGLFAMRYHEQGDRHAMPDDSMMFSRRARESGYRVWAHLGLDIGHIGLHTFRASQEKQS